MKKGGIKGYKTKYKTLPRPWKISAIFAACSSSSTLRTPNTANCGLNLIYRGLKITPRPLASSAYSQNKLQFVLKVLREVPALLRLEVAAKTRRNWKRNQCRTLPHFGGMWRELEAHRGAPVRFRRDTWAQLPWMSGSETALALSRYPLPLLLLFDKQIKCIHQGRAKIKAYKAASRATMLEFPASKEA